MNINSGNLILFSLTALLLCSTPADLQSQNVYAWGDNTYGQCNVPSDLTNATAIAGGLNHSVALRADGTVVAWGDNSYGQTNVPQGLTNVIAITASYRHSVALKSDGTVVAWGDNTYGQLNTPFDLTNVVSISAGYLHTLALLPDGRVRAWGNNSYGQGSVPTDLNDVVAIESGGGFSLALKSDGTVRAWGDSSLGQLGIPSGTQGITALAAGNGHSLALKTNGTVISWGTPSYVLPDLTGITAIATESGNYQYFNLVISNRHTVIAWGDNSFGQCTVPILPVPVLAVAGGGYHSLCLVSADNIGIVEHPKDQARTVWSRAYFAVEVFGTPPFNYQYQWYFESSEIEGATNSTLILTNLTISQSGRYRVVVSNNSVQITSEWARLVVFHPSLDIELVPRVKIVGETGLTYRLEFTSHLTISPIWTALDEITLTNSPQWYLDMSGSGLPARFYRLMQIQP